MASTYKDILTRLAKPATEKAHIHLNDAVTSIQSPNRQPGLDHSVTVKTAGGKQYIFDELVTTFPLGWLKRNKAVFTPALPERLSQAIDNISYGRLEKLFVRFPEAFWQVGDGENTQSPFTQFLSPMYASQPDGPPYSNQDCFSLAALPEPHNHPILLFYYPEPFSTQITSQLSGLAPDSAEYRAILDSFARPLYSRLPGFIKDSASCQPVAFLSTSWQTDEWAGEGSYSNFQVGLEDGYGDIEVMREGMGLERGVWFAGEHTAPLVGLGTTAGAYWSGEEVAKRVVIKQYPSS